MNELVVIESPLRGAVPEWVTRWLPFLAPLVERVGRWQNRRYACACMRDSLARRESPYASHLMFDQRGILDDAKPEERERGMGAGFAWGKKADLVAVYVDRGVSSGMWRGIAAARFRGCPVEYRALHGEAKDQDWWRRVERVCA